MNNQLYDVIAVNHKTNKIEWCEQNKTLKNAEAIVSMAVMRQGCDKCFFTEIEAGKYKTGDLYII